MGQAAPGRSLRVFLCHSSGDKPAVRALYRRLADAGGIQPWLDEEDLLPGQDWAREIPKAVRASDIVVVCISRASSTKAGYLQREIKYALDVADEQPDGTIYIIPLRLEPCETPERLSKWQWVDYFEEGGYERLLRALRVRAGTIMTPGSAVVDGNQLNARPPAPAGSPPNLEQSAAEVPGGEPTRRTQSRATTRKPGRPRRSEPKQGAPAEPTQSLASPPEPDHAPIDPRLFFWVGVGSLSVLVAFGIVVVFLLPEQTQDQRDTYRGIYALLSALALGAGSGFIRLKADTRAVGQSVFVSAGGALAVFALVYFAPLPPRNSGASSPPTAAPSAITSPAAAPPVAPATAAPVATAPPTIPATAMPTAASPSLIPTETPAATLPPARSAAWETRVSGRPPGLMLDDPRGVAVDREGYIYVAVASTGQIQKRQPDGSGLTTVPLTGQGAGRASQPYSVAVSSKEQALFVTDTTNHRIQKLSLGGDFRECWGGDPCTVKLALNEPKGITVAAALDRIYISDSGNRRVLELTSGGEITRCWGGSNCNSGANIPANIAEPHGLAIDNAGVLYAADAGNSTIHRLTPDGWTPWTQVRIGSDQQRAPTPRTFMRPRGVAVYQGEVYVADTEHHRILKLSPDGVFLESWGGPSEGSGPDQFNFPRQITVDDYGNVYVADAGNDRIQLLVR